MVQDRILGCRKEAYVWQKFRKKDSCEDIIKLNRMPGVGKQHAVLTRPHSWLTIKQKPGKRRSAWNTAQNTHCSNDLALTPDSLIRSGCFSQLPNRQRCCATHCAGAVAEASGQTPWVFMGAEFERRATCMFSAGLGLSLLGVQGSCQPGARLVVTKSAVALVDPLVLARNGSRDRLRFCSHWACQVTTVCKPSSEYGRSGSTDLQKIKGWRGPCIDP